MEERYSTASTGAMIGMFNVDMHVCSSEEFAVAGQAPSGSSCRTWGRISVSWSVPRGSGGNSSKGCTLLDGQYTSRWR